MNVILNPYRTTYNPSIWLEVRADMIYVDVGAHRGDTTLQTLKRFPDLRVVAIEPYPPHFEQLERNLTSGKLINKGCWSEKGFKTLYPTADQMNKGCSFIKRRDSLINRGIRVEVDTLDNILSELGLHTVDLIKIDTEGAEHEVLKGFTKYRENTQFHIECHSNLEQVLLELLKKKKPRRMIIGISSKPDPGGGLSTSVHGWF